MEHPPIRGRRSGHVTLADVAKVAEVSPITVSRALRGERRVDPALVDKVRAVAESMGYVPHPAARALATTALELRPLSIVRAVSRARLLCNK